MPGRRSRFVLKALAALVVSGTTLALGSLRLVDRTPWESLPALASVSFSSPADRDAGFTRSEGLVRAGFGRARLTPRLGAVVDKPEQGEFTWLPMAGYGNRKGRPAEGVHDELWTKAVAFGAGGHTNLMISADLLIIPREVAETGARRIEALTGLSREAIYFGATHTHSSIGGWASGWVGEAFAGPFRTGVQEWIADRLSQAAVDALKDLQPAELGSAEFDCAEFVRNRLVGEKGEIEPSFHLVMVRRADGTRAVLGSYAAHATVLSGSFMQLSGDYPGAWQRHVEEKMSAMALFFAGAVGSHGPRAPARGVQGVERMGEELARRTLEFCTGLTLTNQTPIRLVTRAMPLPGLQVRLTDGISLRPWIARQLIPAPGETWLQALRLGNSVWFSTPCDYSGELALGLKAELRDRGLSAAVTSFNGDYVGYVVPARYYGLPSYETRTMSFFGPQLPGYMDHCLRGLAGLVINEGSLPGGRSVGQSPVTGAGALTNEVSRR